MFAALDNNGVDIYAACDDAAGSSLAPDKVANTTAATDDATSKYGATDTSAGSSEILYPTADTSATSEREHTLSMYFWRVFVHLVSCLFVCVCVCVCVCLVVCLFFFVFGWRFLVWWFGGEMNGGDLFIIYTYLVCYAHGYSCSVL